MTAALPPHPATVGPRPVRRGRPPTLSRDLIAAAAIRLGFERLTLSAVAKELGVSNAALYHHVADLSDLASASIDLLGRSSTWPDAGTEWRTYLSGHAEVLWSVLAADPALVIAATGAPSPPSAVHHVNEVVRELIRQGFDPADALLAVDTVFDLVHDVFARGEQLRVQRNSDGELAWLEQLAPDIRPVAAAAVADPRTWFVRKLAVVLDGIEHGLAPQRTTKRTPTKRRVEP